MKAMSPAHGIYNVTHQPGKKIEIEINEPTAKHLSKRPQSELIKMYQNMRQQLLFKRICQFAFDVPLGRLAVMDARSHGWEPTPYVIQIV